MTWTDERLEQLRHRWLDCGESAGVIAKAMGLTRNQVMGKIHRSRWSRTIPLKVIPYPVRKKLAKPVRRVLRPMIARKPTTPHEGAVGLLELRFGDCKRPVGEDANGFLFCAKSAEQGSSYCSDCAKICFVPSKVRA